MKLSFKILIHSIFWIVFTSFTITFMYSQYTILDTFNRLPHIVINIFWAVSVFYLFYFYFIKFFEQAFFVKYLLYSILTGVVVSFIFVPIHKIFLPQLSIFNISEMGPHIVGTFIIAQCGSLVKGFENWVDNIKIKAELETRNAKNELELLKSQINPHFLFNTLNNIDTLIHKSPDDASRSLITLSDMLRYMIYDTNTERVALSKELEYIKHYINLQKLRIPDPDFINTTVPENCSQKIAPMLLLPFIENAFKYAVNNGQEPRIVIDLNCNDSMLIFKCTNKYSDSNALNINSGGVGLENVKRRLELIYPHKHELKISKENNIFNVELKLELN
ncbi:MAG: histidine kinase [Salinivirgaceae bacterium]|jgi:two-component system LytT family sensor kinase|nr:histidine kinase [Salinivirgaceae bacterium]